MQNKLFYKTAGVLAILAFPMAMVCNVLPLWAANFNADIFTDPLLYLDTGSRGALYWRWAMLLDMLGYYLLITPLILVLGNNLKNDGALPVKLYTQSLLAYVLIGAIGAAILSTTIPSILITYPQASQKESLTHVYIALMDAVYKGLWNTLEELLAGVGWIGFGSILLKKDRWLGWFTVVLGIACLADGVFTMIGLDAAALPGLAAYLLMAPVWGVWLGVLLLKRQGVFGTLIT